MALPNPTLLSSTTRFRPTHVRAHSRSPSRSPVRKAQFTAQHLDPLLRNLSPDSTLKALKATETIPLGPEQDILTKSITDATPQEREIGIRAAFAAQKLREWRNEISRWTWPDRKDRALGAGFLPPQDEANAVDQNGKRRIYLGHLPLSIVDRYEQRIDEIRDALETLEMEDIKDHVLQAHSPSSQAASSTNPPQTRIDPRKSYGRMRDFTALITATVIQALPDLAIVTMLIDTWNIRLTVLRDLPMLYSVMQASKVGIRTASATIRDANQAPLITLQDFETTKRMLGDKVSDLGSRIDRMLDLLEGQEDSLPQGWIDSLETVELDYATWVVEAQRIATRNQSAMDAKEAEVSTAGNPPATHLSDAGPVTSNQSSHPIHKQELNEPDSAAATPSIPNRQDSHPALAAPKPALTLETPSQRGHRREISEVSVADSAYSAFSDVSKAEIIDATQTQLLPSPKVSVVDSPSRPEVAKPPMLQRASTASIEVISKDQLKRVDLRRSMSADLLSKMSPTQESTPSTAWEQLTSRPRTGTTPVAELEDPTSALALDPAKSSTHLPPPVLDVDPLKGGTRPSDEEGGDVPNLPRKSSKRKSVSFSDWVSEGQPAHSDIVSPIEPPDVKVWADLKNQLVSPMEPPDTKFPSQAHHPVSAPIAKRTDSGGESLEAKIQDILLKLPTKIRLAKNPDGVQSTEDSSASSTRASTPVPALTLSPVKPSRKSLTSDTDVRVFHLTQHGQSRDAAPIKLLVRTVGENGERVMVRVGGGWADLGEYLKEYSLHHGHRSVSEAQLEVAQYPGKQRKDSIGAAAPPRKVRHVRGRSRSPSPPRKDDDEKVWTPPPVPPIPTTYTVQTPTMTSISRPNGVVETRVDDPEPSSSDCRDINGVTPDGPPATVRTSTMEAPGVTTTTTISVPRSNKTGTYTPLGAAGPKAAARRSVTFGGTPATDNDKWVEGVVDKARAVSSNVVHGPTTTTTTKVVASAPSSRRASAMMTPAAPAAPQKTPSSTASSKAAPKEDSPVGRRRSILGFGDVGGIKRVFLRRKTEK